MQPCLSYLTCRQNYIASSIMNEKAAHENINSSFSFTSCTPLINHQSALSGLTDRGAAPSNTPTITTVDRISSAIGLALAQKYMIFYHRPQCRSFLLGMSDISHSLYSLHVPIYHPLFLHLVFLANQRDDDDAGFVVIPLGRLLFVVRGWMYWLLIIFGGTNYYGLRCQNRASCFRISPSSVIYGRDLLLILIPNFPCHLIGHYLSNRYSRQPLRGFHLKPSHLIFIVPHQNTHPPFIPTPTSSLLSLRVRAKPIILPFLTYLPYLHYLYSPSRHFLHYFLSFPPNASLPRVQQSLCSQNYQTPPTSLH